MRRQNRTRQWIAEGYLELTELYPLGKITVQKICDHMEINRSTFYYHFESIQDLIHWLYHHEVNEPVLRKIETHEEFRQGISIVALTNIYKRRSFWQRVLSLKTREEFEDFVLRDTQENWRQVMNAILAKEGISMDSLSQEQQAELSYIREYYCCAHYHVTMLWMKQGMKMPPEELAGLMDGIATNGFFYATRHVLDR